MASSLLGTHDFECGVVPAARGLAVRLSSPGERGWLSVVVGVLPPAHTVFTERLEALIASVQLVLDRRPRTSRVR